VNLHDGFRAYQIFLLAVSQNGKKRGSEPVS
jgi:hypothetical protein